MCPFGGGGPGSPSNTMWPGPRPCCMSSFILIRLTVGTGTFRAQDLSFPRTNSPYGELSFPRLFIPGNFRSEEAYTTQHRTVLIIFPVILQTTIIAQMMSAGEEGEGVINKEQLSLLDMVGRQPTLLMPVTTSGATSSILWNVGSSQFHEG